jgi:hypothetical protein
MLNEVKMLEKANATLVRTGDGGEAIAVAPFPAKGAAVRAALKRELAQITNQMVADLLIGSLGRRDFRGRVTAPTVFGGFGEPSRRISLVDQEGQGSFIFEEILGEDGEMISARESRLDDPEIQRRYSHLLETGSAASQRRE